MKSIMEEASSISKAIDLAWQRAGKPLQFSVKVLEEPQRNMFGLTVKSAKVALFFEEPKKTERPFRQPERTKVIHKEAPTRNGQTSTAKRGRIVWTDALAQEAQEWLKNTLRLAGFADAQYSSSYSGTALKFIFDNSLTGTQNKDRMLFSSFAQLLLATLRHRHQQHLKYLKVILITK